MKRSMKAIFVALVITALASISAMAGDKGKVEKKMVTFTEDTMVNGTLIKAGEYEVKFDDSTGELSVIKNGKVKAKTVAHYEARSGKAKDTALRTIEAGGNVELKGITFGGSDQDVIVGARGSVSGTQ
ncbi:MAG TPA: hypothetical protein VLN44_03090 [Pyrinomonadaceae bacterium]|nr:hypothetical protein [Pyrinomonadaceae bacterium]